MSDRLHSFSAGHFLEIDLFQFCGSSCFVLSDRTTEEPLTDTCWIHHVEERAFLLGLTRDQDCTAERSQVPVQSVIVDLTAVHRVIRRDEGGSDGRKKKNE